MLIRNPIVWAESTRKQSYAIFCACAASRQTNVGSQANKSIPDTWPCCSDSQRPCISVEAGRRISSKIFGQSRPPSEIPLDAVVDGTCTLYTGVNKYCGSCDMPQRDPTLNVYNATCPGAMELKYSSIYQLWSDWYINFVRAENVLVIRYEDVVLYTEEVLQVIARAAECELRKVNLLALKKHASPGTSPKGDAHAFAIAKLRGNGADDEWQAGLEDLRPAECRVAGAV